MIDEGQVASRKRINLYRLALALFMQLLFIGLVLLVGFGTDESHWAFGLSLLPLIFACMLFVLKTIFSFDWFLGPGLKYDAAPSWRMHSLRDAAEGISLAAGIKAPEVACIDYGFRNAFSMEKHGNASIYLTRGLVESLSEKELAAVIAHEVAHIRNGDVSIPYFPVEFNLPAASLLLHAFVRKKPLPFITALLFLLPLITYMAVVDISGMWKFIPALIILCVFFVAVPLRIAIDPQSNSNLADHDYLADACAFRWTLDPEALVRALRGAQANSLHKKLSFLNWVTFVPISDTKSHSSIFGRGTIHVPTVDERIGALEAMAHVPL
jgi:Zn-dependent protease with chaperone function